MHPEIAEFINKLQNEVVDNLDVCNMYSIASADNSLRVGALKAYLESFIEKQPALILVGEAPGYRGCRVSGIPFTSTGAILKSEYLRKLGLTGLEKVQNEATASVVWEYLDSKKSYPLLWNAYPFHPHNRSNDATNRKPTRTELEIGKGYLLALHRIFASAELVAVGKVAHESLNSIGINTPYVRHPSYGGKAEFIQGLEKLQANMALPES